MVQSTSFLVILVALTTGLILEQNDAFVSGYEFDRDVDAELCKNDIGRDPGVCTSNSTMWFSCPISCSEALYGGSGTMAEEKDDPERFYELYAKRAVIGGGTGNKHVSLEHNEGYITLYAILPVLPGMALYYADAIEHISQVYKYTVVAMILPYYTDETDEEGNSAILQSILESRRRMGKDGKTKSILLEGHGLHQMDDNKILEYLYNREKSASNFKEHEIENKMNLLTRPNIFVVSHTGAFIEHVVSPTIEMIERRIKVHELVMENQH